MRKRLDCVGIVEDEDEIGQLETDLATKTRTSSRDRARCAPRAIRKTCDNEAATESGGAEEAGLDNREDGEAPRRGEDRGRNDLVRPEGLSGIDERGQNLAAFLTLRCWVENVSHVVGAIGCLRG